MLTPWPSRSRQLVGMPLKSSSQLSCSARHAQCQHGCKLVRERAEHAWQQGRTASQHSGCMPCCRHAAGIQACLSLVMACNSAQQCSERIGRQLICPGGLTCRCMGETRRTMWVLSGWWVRKSSTRQPSCLKVTAWDSLVRAQLWCPHSVWAHARLSSLPGLGFSAWFRSTNFLPSLTKNTGNVVACQHIQQGQQQALQKRAAAITPPASTCMQDKG